MSQPSTEVIRGIYDAFARADIPAILSTLDEQIDWRAPENLPQGGHFSGRDAVAGFFRKIGEHWETLTADIDHILSGGDQVVVLARLHGTLRATGEDTGYSSAHAWTLRDGTPIRFAETVDAPLSLPAAVAAP
jgi:ketosteroid isomerase-like protein